MDMLREPASSGKDLVNCALHSFNIDFKVCGHSFLSIVWGLVHSCGIVLVAFSKWPRVPFQGENHLITDMDIFSTMRSLLLQGGGEKGTQEYLKAAWVLFDIIMTKVVKDQVCCEAATLLSHPRVERRGRGGVRV